MQRLKNDWPNGMFRPSSDEKFGVSRQTYDGGGRGRQLLSSDSDSSSRFAHASYVIRSDSDSDSDPKKWTKNPLVVRRVKRSDKVKPAEKRYSGSENVFSAKSRDSIVYPNNEDSRNRTANAGVKTVSSKDEESGSRTNTKYQRLEQMRKMRLNLSVTSDEESVPQRPQHHRWSGSNIRNVTAATNDTEAASQQHPVRSQLGQEVSRIGNVPTTLRQEFHLNARPNTTKPPTTASFAYAQPNIPPAAAKTTSLLSNFNTGLRIQPATSGLSETINRLSHSQIQLSGHFPESNMADSRQTFNHLSHMPGSQTTPYKIGDINVHRNSPLAFPNSSNANSTNRLTSQVPVPSVHSALESKSSTAYNRSAVQPQNPTYFRARQSPPQERPQITSTTRSSSHVNSVLEKRQTPPNVSKAKCLKTISRQMLPRSGFLEPNYDSLDELVESNIQYLSGDADPAKAKKSSHSVIKFSSLPDHGRISGRVVSTPAAHNQASIQVQASTSIQLHVTVPGDSPHLATSLIQVAPSGDLDLRRSFGLQRQLTSQPDIIPKSFSQDVYAPLLSHTHTGSHHGTEALSRPDSQALVPPSRLGLGTAHTRLPFGDRKPQSDTEISLQAPRLDKGMFSDAEYDVEVSERVKKWETFMKVRDGQPSSDRKNLITINENVENDSQLSQTNVTKSMIPSKQSNSAFSYTRESNDDASPRILSIETNASRFFRVIPDPRLTVKSQGVSNKIFQTPLSLRPEKTFTSASELRQQMLENRVHPLPVTSAPMQAKQKWPQPGDYKQQDTPPSETPSVTRPSNLNDARNPEKRDSRYKEELSEISYMKSESVGNLRRRFDTDSTNATSEDDKKSVSTASAKLALPSKGQSLHTQPTDWSQILPRGHPKIIDSEVWSPNLESTQGVPVSIERVTARTLQTIPFSEDPFWKQIEQMTTFDPARKEGLLTPDPIRSHHEVQLISTQSSTLPSQPHRSVTSMPDKLQKSKSLYTPNITPLTVNINNTSLSKTVNPLDDVLNEISRSPTRKTQLSPKKRSTEVDSSPTSLASSGVSRFLKTRPKSNNFGNSESGQPIFTYPGLGEKSGSSQTVEFGHRILYQSDMMAPQPSQQLKFYQQPRQNPQPNLQTRQPQATQGFTNNYQLDPDLLKQKLLKTGLVVDMDKEEVADRGHLQSSSLGRPSHSLTNNATAQEYTRLPSRLHTDARSAPPTTLTSSQDSNRPNLSRTSTNIFLKTPGKQPGSKTLDEIREALAPFSATSYKPDPETLYGPSKLQAFENNVYNTSIGPHTSATGWSYHTQLDDDIDRSNTVDSSLSGGSSRLQEVNESMDDLTNLARDVELKINEIKSKLESADERSLDSILLSLRKLTPEVKTQDTDNISFDDYYSKKKSKLSDALSELDRIHSSLELGADDINTLPGKEQVGSEESKFHLRGSQQKSVHLRPMQTRISSVFIRDIDANKTTSSTEKESEFDVLSKSFEAIINEVNQTTDLLSRAVERSKQDNMAPEMHKPPSKTTVLTANVDKTTLTTTNLGQSVDVASTVQNSLQQIQNTVTTTSSSVTSSVSLPSSAGHQQTRFRPVKDNKIIQDDKAGKKDNEDKVFRAMASPKPSPTLARKLFNNDQGAKVKEQMSSHDTPGQQTAQNGTVVPLQIDVKENAKYEKNKDISKSDQPLFKNKEVPSVVDSQAQASVLKSNTEIQSDTSQSSASRQEIGKVLAASHEAAGDLKTADSSSCVSGGVRLSSAPASAVSSVFVPSTASIGKQSKLSSTSKLDDSEQASTNGSKTKRQIGSGVAMLLGRFSSSQESIDGSKKDTNIRAESGHVGSEIDQNNTTDKLTVQTQSAGNTEDQITVDVNMKSPVRSLTKTNSAHSYDKSTILPSLERKLVDPETKALNSGASSPQPSSPVNKPPQSPWKRHTSDPEKQSVADAVKTFSPKFTSKIPRGNSSNGSTASEGYFTPKELESPRPVLGSPVVTSKDRPPVWKSPNSSPRGRGRPHSFHELISVFEKDSSNRLQSVDKFRKCVSADEVNSHDSFVKTDLHCVKTVPEETIAEKANC